jgi:hypothetical protein
VKLKSARIEQNIHLLLEIIVKEMVGNQSRNKMTKKLSADKLLV